MKSNLTIKGTRGFTFEFKSLPNGNAAFIRYKEGEREYAMTTTIHTGLYREDFEKDRCIDETLRMRVGSSDRLIKAVKAWLAAK